MKNLLFLIGFIFLTGCSVNIKMNVEEGPFAPTQSYPMMDFLPAEDK